MYSVSLVSRYMSRPTELRLMIAKRILRYLRGTSSFRIQYKREWRDELKVFSNSDYIGDIDDRLSTTRYVFLLSSGSVC